jgi:hypothetical protein
MASKVEGQKLMPSSPIARARRGDGKRFIVHADQKLPAFIQLESAIRAVSKADIDGDRVRTRRSL